MVDEDGASAPIGSVKVGDKVCLETQKASDGTAQITKMMVADDSGRARVRGRIDKAKDSEGAKKAKTGEPSHRPKG